MHRATATLFCLAIASIATAEPDIVVTEIWPGNIPGDENTSDWFEITNLGDTTATGLENYHFRDNPVPDGAPDGLPLAGGQLTNISTLEPGESVVILVNWTDPIGTEFEPDLQFAIDAFRAMWGEEYVDSIKLAWTVDAQGEGGPGFSGNGDSVILFDGPVTGSAIVDEASYPQSMYDSFIYNPETQVFGDLAVDGLFGAFEGLLPAGTGATAPYVASPGVIDGPCAGDCDDSGVVDFNDLVSALFEFGNTDEGRCDADDSGTIDFNDLVATLFLFGPCD